MKKILFLLSYLCLGLAARAEVTDVTQYDNVLYAESVSGTAGSMVTLSLKLNNIEEVTGYQVDLVLPEGVTVATDEDGFYLTELSTARTTSKKMDYFNSAKQEDGSIRIMCSSTGSIPFSGNEGEVATIPLCLDANLADGTYPIVLKDEVISFRDANGCKVSSVECELHVGEIVDEGYAVQIIPFSLTQGTAYDSEAETGNYFFTVQLANAADAVTIDFDLTLPNGMGIGTYQYNAGTPKKPVWVDVYDLYYAGDYASDQYFPTAEDNEDGTIHVSATDVTFTASAVPVDVIQLPVTVSEDMENGVYELILKNVVITDAESHVYHAASYKCTVFVGDLSALTTTPAFHGTWDDEGIETFNEAFAENASLTSIDFSNAVVVSDVALTTANKNAVFFLSEGSNVSNECNVVEGDVCAKLVLTDGFAFGPAKAFTVKAGEYGRTLEADTYGTIVLPFAPDAETMKGYTFYEMTGVETDALTFDEVANPVAGKPYIVTSDGAATKMTAEAESVVAIEPTATEVDGWTMTGTYDSVVFTDANELANLYCISGNQFKQATSKLTMNPFRAYFVGDGSVSSINLRDNDGTTNIISLNSPFSILNSPLYDLQGRQVEHPAQGGIYIQNGKKVLVK